MLHGPIFNHDPLDHYQEFWLARPFLLGMPVDELKSEFQVELIKQTDSEIWLKLIPRTKSKQAFFEEAQVRLTRVGYLPLAVKIMGYGGKETIHVFSDIRITSEDDENLDGSERLDRADLAGYVKL